MRHFFLAITVCQNAIEYMIRETTITHCKPTHGTVRKGHGTITITRHQKDRQSKASNSLFPIKMIAKLEKTQSNAQQKMEQTPKPHIGGNTKQWINDNRTAALECTHLGVSSRYRVKCPCWRIHRVWRACTVSSESSLPFSNKQNMQVEEMIWPKVLGELF